MNVPDECKPPKPGKLAAWCKVNFCGGAWLIVNEHRRIITQFVDPIHAARHINKHNQERK